MNRKISEMENYAKFISVCRYDSCDKEYPGWTGEEKYIIYSQYVEEMLVAEFPEIMKALSPYILLDLEMKNSVTAFRNNEIKHYSRSSNCICLDEFIHDQETMTLEETEISLELQDALAKLTETQKRRVSLYYFWGYSLDEIAKLECSSKIAVWKTIKSGEKQMMKYLCN